MDKKLKLPAVLILLVILVISCKTSKDQGKSDPVTTTAQPTQGESQTNEDNSKVPLETQIIGSWEWWKTICCGRTPHTETSESLKAPKILKFQTDGVLKYFSGDEQTSSKTYKIGLGLMNNERPIIDIEAGRTGMLFIKGDTLIIDYGYMDLQTEFYLRRKQ